MAILTPDEAQTVLAPYMGRLDRCVHAGWDFYNSQPADFKVTCTTRTRAGIVRDAMVDFAKREFDGDPDVQFVYRRGLFLVMIQNQIVVRFKKLNPRFRSSNYPTQQAIQFMNAMLPLDGVPASMRCDVGYVLNKLQTEIQRSAIVAHFSADRPLYVIYLSDQDASGDQPTLFELPVRPTQAPSVETTVTVREAPAEAADGTLS